MNNWTQNWITPVKVLLAGVGISAMAFLSTLVISAQPPANAVIGNQAGATYKDASGKDQTALSNLVTTTVAQVAGLTLTNDTTKTVAAGNTAYMPHALTNTGNGADTFKIDVTEAGGPSDVSAVAIYPDVNGTGVPSGPALCNDAAAGSTPPKCADGFLQSVSAGQTFNFVVAYVVPATATVSAPYDVKTVTATSQSPAGVTGVKVASNTDTINVTSLAAFNANKAIKAPAVAAAAGANWPLAVTSGQASPANCPAVWSPTLVSANPLCTYTVYTISYTNTGGAVGSFSMQDVIGTGATAGLTYVTGSAVWSGAGGVALDEAGGTTGSGTSQVRSEWDSTTKTFKATVSNVAPNVSGTISFVVLLNSTASAGTGTTSNVAGYWTTSCDPAAAINGANCDGSGTPTTTTNTSPLPVLSVYGVIAANNAAATTVDGGIPSKTGENLAVQDVVLHPLNTVAQGATASFIDYVINKGTAADSFNVTLAEPGANNTFPAGTVFALFKEDGVTPLSDTNSDGIVDTGPLEPDDSSKIVVKATVPSSAAVAATTPADVLLTATSIADGSKKDYVWNEVAGIVAPTSKVDLTNSPTGGITKNADGTFGTCTPGVNCDEGQGPSPSPTFTNSTEPGVSTSFPVYIANTTTDPAVYDLSSTAPPGWTVTITEGSTCPGTPIKTASVPAGSQQMYTACVTPPVGASTGTAPVDITATLQGNPSVTDTLRDAVMVTSPTGKPGMQLGPDSGSSNVSNGGTVVQPTTLTNTGNAQCGAGGNGLTAKLTLDAASLAAGWQAVLFYDKNGSGVIDAGDVQLNTQVAADTFSITDATLGFVPPDSLVPLAPGAKLPLLVKLSAPTSASNGQKATVTLLIHDTNPTVSEACPDDAATFNSTVLNSQLRVSKTQGIDNGCQAPGSVVFSAEPLPIVPTAADQCIVYKVVAENQGQAPVTNVVMNDVVPAFTSYAPAASQPAVQCEIANGTTGTVTFVAPVAPSKAVSCGTATSIPPLGTMTMVFSVMVQK